MNMKGKGIRRNAIKYNLVWNWPSVDEDRLDTIQKILRSKYLLGTMKQGCRHKILIFLKIQEIELADGKLIE